MRDGAPADDPEVQEPARRWDALADRFHAAGRAGEQTKTASQRAWEENSEEVGRRLPWPAERMRELLVYLDEARRVRQDGASG